MSKPYAETFFEENLTARIVLVKAARHILQHTPGLQFDANGVFIPETAPEAFRIVYGLIVDLESDFQTAKTIQAAKKASVA